MIRLQIIVEGQTEETFVNKLLSPHLGSCNVFASARRVETGRKHGKIFRGGMISYGKAKKDIELWMKQEVGDDVRFTTMFDFYRLPTDFPGFEEARAESDPYRKVELIESQFKQDVGSLRFIPYIQLHEYETLLFAGLDQFHHFYLDHQPQITSLRQEVVGITNPELINENPITAPSKRIIKHLPSYAKEKTTAGPIIAENIGLPKIRLQCRHFDSWVSKLEGLAGPS